MEEGTEGPHRALTTELVTLDLILSFVDRKSQLEARRVCKSWNDCILDKFHLKHDLCFKSNSALKNGEIRSRLESFDRRVLTSLEISITQRERARKLMWLFFKVLRSRGDEDCLVNLDLLLLNGKGLAYLIRLANEGRFKNLRKLYFQVELGFNEEGYKCPYRVNEAAFPKLQELGNFVLHQYKWKEDIEEAFQSFVSAAPNLTSLQVGTELDLSGLKKVKKLRICECGSLKDEDAGARIVQSVKRNLTSLELDLICGLCPSVVIRNLPKLSNLWITALFSEGEGFLLWPDWSSLPKLRIFALSCKAMFIPEEEEERALQVDVLASFLPLPESLNMIQLWDFPVKDEIWAVKWLTAILKSKVPHLVVRLDKKVRISVVLNILESCIPETMAVGEVKGKTQRVLEFHNGHRGDVLKTETLQNFSNVVEKLRTFNIDVLFTDFEDQTKEAGKD